MTVEAGKAIPEDVAGLIAELRAKRERFIESRHLPRRPKGFCKWCAGPVAPPRRTWCSQACVDAFMVRSNANSAAHALWKRDRGVCADCGFDFGWAARRIKVDLEFWVDDLEAANGGSLPRGWARPQDDRLRAGLKARGFDLLRRLWEVDHTTPVVFGGGCAGVDELETVCQLCHRERTRKLAGLRASMDGRPKQEALF